MPNTATGKTLSLLGTCGEQVEEWNQEAIKAGLTFVLYLIPG